MTPTKPQLMASLCPRFSLVSSPSRGSQPVNRDVLEADGSAGQGQAPPTILVNAAHPCRSTQGVGPQPRSHPRGNALWLGQFTQEWAQAP